MLKNKNSRKIYITHLKLSRTEMCITVFKFHLQIGETERKTICQSCWLSGQIPFPFSTFHSFVYAQAIMTRPVLGGKLS
jgi:hypothetical protein